MDYVYGPVSSRRLGRSLGVNVIPFKTCNYSCVYCQLGKTTSKINERRSFFPKEDILREVELSLKNVEADHITFAGEGEPTLCRDIGWLIRKIKEITDIPVAVITNGSLLYREDVREDLMEADVVIPSLDAADTRTFRRINRPHRDLKIEEIIDGQVEFSRSYRGKLYVEVMLVKNFNDGEESLLSIRDALNRIKPDGVYILTPIRPPASRIEPADEMGLLRANAIIGDVTKIIQPEVGEFFVECFSSAEEAVMMVLRRHPMREEQLVELLRKFDADLSILESIEGIEKVEFMGKTFYLYRPPS
ncbi:radical SAM protein [Archaeoglobus veneficus]|uniref:Radical SAM domain protein n=1 Tax=Archaeoglobus veneficus (strain DSM 11195 / SNP6) TaxID=693661 RepID=F2KRC4_ARCVS|nr:radical SAM protein [Archaeoglobus veneficus]AEA47858.1 Radical SAM domain protein [Archaeoglobus veneficus SNP6]